LSAAVFELLAHHRIIAIRCNPVDREWLVDYLGELIKIDCRWRVTHLGGSVFERMEASLIAIYEEKDRELNRDRNYL
jgi:hypothetical protein